MLARRAARAQDDRPMPIGTSQAGRRALECADETTPLPGPRLLPLLVAQALAGASFRAAARGGLGGRGGPLDGDGPRRAAAAAVSAKRGSVRHPVGRREVG